MSSLGSLSARRASLDTQLLRTRFRASPSSKSKWTITSPSRSRNLPGLFNRLNRKSKKRKPSWRLESRNYEPFARECPRLKTSIRARRRTTMPSSSRWRLRRSRSQRTWALSSRNIRKQNLSSTRTTCRLTSSKLSRREFSARRSIFQIQTSA